MRWRSSAYISPQKIDHDDVAEEDEVKGTTYAKAKDATTAEEEEYAPRASDRVVCLMDIARPAKRKGECLLVILWQDTTACASGRNVYRY